METLEELSKLRLEGYQWEENDDIDSFRKGDLESFILQKLEQAEERVRGEIIQNSEGFIQTALMPESAYKLAYEQGRIRGRGEAVEIARGLQINPSKMGSDKIGEWDFTEYDVDNSHNSALTTLIQRLTNKE